MTIQAPERLERDDGAAELPPLKLYGVVVGDIDKPESSGGYPFMAKGDPSKMTLCTALWRGYVSGYRLRADGSLVLERFEYPFTPGAAPDLAHEVLAGDFWIELREWFMGSGVRVPFREGRIVQDVSEWRNFEGIPQRHRGAMNRS